MNRPRSFQNQRAIRGTHLAEELSAVSPTVGEIASEQQIEALLKLRHMQLGSKMPEQMMPHRRVVQRAHH